MDGNEQESNHELLAHELTSLPMEPSPLPKSLERLNHIRRLELPKVALFERDRRGLPERPSSPPNRHDRFSPFHLKRFFPFHETFKVEDPFDAIGYGVAVVALIEL